MFDLISTEIDGYCGFGTIQLHTNNEKNNYVLKMFEDILNESKVESLNLSENSEQSVFTTFLDEKCAQNEHLCGGKGSSLGYLTKLSIKNEEFVVPPGFIITTKAFDHQVKQDVRLQNALMALENIAHKRIDGSLKDACDNLSKLFSEISIESEVEDAIKQSFKNLKNNFNEPLKLAVRSSAIGEDGSESSSAGQNETFLGVVGIEQVMSAIKKCWASLFTVQSVTYRIQNIQPIQTQMAVVVQVMVAADCAGVLFTHHPVNNHPNKMLITANYGLGEVRKMIFLILNEIF